MFHKSLAIERHDLVAEWHPSKNLPLTPKDVTLGSATLVWWKCPRGPDHVWEARVSRRALYWTGCPFCANRRVGLKNSLAVLMPKVAREWHPTKNGVLRPKDVVPGSRKMAWWRCHVGHEWQVDIRHRTQEGYGCPYCSGHRVTAERSLAAVAPAVARTWHPTKNGALKPTDVASGSDKKAWWLCKRGHEWRTTITGRARRGNGCPMCSGHKFSPERSLAAVAPKVAATWHPTRNGRLRPKDDPLVKSPKPLIGWCETTPYLRYPQAESLDCKPQKRVFSEKRGFLRRDQGCHGEQRPEGVVAVPEGPGPRVEERDC
jgi:Probable Zinc-ribbon domain